jgi:hypothetical protein
MAHGARLHHELQLLVQAGLNTGGGPSHSDIGSSTPTSRTSIGCGGVEAACYIAARCR